MRRHLLPLVPFLALALAAGACSGDDDAPAPAAGTGSTAAATTTTTRGATTSRPTTSSSTTTTVPSKIAPLTGVAVPLDTPDRPALGVKIDANLRAEPQFGLDVADVV